CHTRGMHPRPQQNDSGSQLPESIPARRPPQADGARRRAMANQAFREAVDLALCLTSLRTLVQDLAFALGAIEAVTSGERPSAPPAMYSSSCLRIRGVQEFLM